MKKYLLLILSLLFLFNFTACATKAENDVSDSSTKDVSELLRTLIQKEKEINELNKKLEDCSQSKTIQ
ncbi:MAG: hypothetical protein RBQ84_09525 [Arcobacter sp.]|jgi:hypothetical protein|uniref:Lipoprotein n=1 Tax=Arcobacter defluvii TaxID=873191 RepID=A0AAE7BCY9_9BACT|nr:MULTISPECIES: hypothetical protein [Arcobacter]MDY3201183.1 hypothetical protein [Arcobacter sp.]QKF76233.1 hypothetical protein ADFLV_0165 [Arcobacter defluvii]RXI30915.1 hypothetical protein CP964_10675 [Arcobacter defluvii]